MTNIRITTDRPGNGEIRVQISKKADDPLGVARVSVGGSLEIGGYYCVYRGRKLWTA